ncbi:MAG: hypothetical protein AAGC57_01295 [Pseudomonadota bacterium]
MIVLPSWLRRHGEMLIALAIAAALARAGAMTLAAGGSVLWALLVLVGAGGAALWAYTAFQRRRLADRAGADGRAAGVLSIDEERIAYFGPNTGGFVALDDLEAIALTRNAAGWTWILAGEAEVLSVPAGAKGADALVDALTVLPGFEPARALAALTSESPGGVTVWERAAGRSRPAMPG